MKTKSESLIHFLSLILLVFFISLSAKTWAQDNEKSESPYFIVKSSDASLDKMPLKKTSVEVDISGVIAHVHVQQVYKNEGKSTIEATYVFPASTQAAVHAMKMHVGERVLIAQIYDKEKARKKYDEAKKEGKTASLLEQFRPNVFKMNVANIMPGDVVQTDLYYTELLIPEKGIYEFVYPTVVGPRYSGSNEESGASTTFVKNPYTHENEKPNYTFDISLNLEAGMPVDGIKSDSHKININYLDKNNAICKLNEIEKFGGDRDFILHYNLRGNKIQSGLLMYQDQDENYFLLMMQPPKKEEIKEIPPREYIFIIDVSGSMNGFPLDISKELIKNLLTNLQAQDCFNIILFAGTSSILSDSSSLKANKENIEKAIEMINKKQGSGGTELASALKRGLALKENKNYSRSFVVITDGYISAEAETFKLITENPSQANFFAFGIGTSVNRHLIEGISRIGQGEAFVITDSNEAKAQANLFKEYIESPVLTNIKLETTGVETYDIQPMSYPDVFADRPILIYGKFKGNLEGEFKVSGFTGDKQYSEVFDIQNASFSEKNSALKYLWARKKIEGLNDLAAFSPTTSVKEEITNIGLKYSLLTEFTSFLAIDSLARKTGNSTTVSQTLPLPKGVSDLAVGNTVTTGEFIIVSDDEDFDYSEVEYDEAIEVEVIEEESEEEVQIFVMTETMPEFPGGELAMRKFISEKLEYPNQAQENGIEGKVYVRFVVRADGRVDNITIARGVDPILDKAAIEVIKKLPPFKPGMQGGKAVNVWYVVPVSFQLE